VPDRSTHACIPRGTTVVVSHGRNQVWAVESGGSLRLTGGALLMMGTVVASETADLHLAEATLGGPGKLIVTRHMFFGPAGKMHGAGSVTLGPASHSEINAGVGKRSAFIGGDDGTGPAVVNSDNAPGPLCNRYSPPWADDCATGHPADSTAIRRTWARFAAVVNDTARSPAERSAALAGLIDPAGDRDRIVRTALREAPLPTVLRTPYVEGQTAIGRPDSHTEPVFARVGGAWVLRKL
jgi:hypothetical protein